MRFINTLREGETSIYARQNARQRQEMGSRMITYFFKIRQELWTEKSGIQIRGGLQIMMRWTLWKFLER